MFMAWNQRKKGELENIANLVCIGKGILKKRPRHDKGFRCDLKMLFKEKFEPHIH